MKYPSPTCVAEADNEAVMIRESWGEASSAGDSATTSPLLEGTVPSAWRVSFELERSGRCSTDGIAWARETTQFSPRYKVNYMITTIPFRFNIYSSLPPSPHYFCFLKTPSHFFLLLCKKRNQSFRERLEIYFSAMQSASNLLSGLRRQAMSLSSCSTVDSNIKQQVKIYSYAHSYDIEK